MTLRPCLHCGEPSDGPRCPEHTPPSPSKPYRTVGYDAAWDALSRRARRLQPFCTACGATSDLTCDHLPIAWERKAAGKIIRLVDVQVLCRSCNSKKGAARDRSTWGDAPVRPSPLPPAKAEFGSENDSQLRGRP